MAKAFPISLSTDPTTRRIQRRTIAMAVGFGLFAAAFAAIPTRAIYRSETWVENSVPAKMPGYRLVLTDPTLPTVSYKMDPTTYDYLKPWGIAARVFEGDSPTTRSQSYDVVVIGGNSKDSFHDPLVCFTAQKWVLSNQRIETISTKTRGLVPVTMVDLTRDSERTIALYTYRLRDGYVANNWIMKLRMFTYKFRALGNDDEGGFIRVIPRNPNANAADLKKFTADWIDEAAQVSGGYY